MATIANIGIDYAEEYKDKYVSRAVFEQVVWENNVAISQLEELGYGLGEKISKSNNNGWIPCEKKLPETNESVLCWAKSTARGGDVCFVGSYHKGFWFLQSSANTHSFPGQYKIVAWQQLPAPYQKGSDV